jgi:predicted nucleic acid-binding protein
LTEKGYLLDTNVVSETRRPRRDARVIAFLAGEAKVDSYLSVLTIGELRKGVEAKRRLDPVAAERIDAWIGRLEIRYAEKTLPVDKMVADMWGRLMADRPRPVVDTMLAATALVHGLTLVTRNTRDVAGTGVNAINPWL